jgi:hypothetical protein
MSNPFAKNWVESWLAKAPVWLTRPRIRKFMSTMVLLVDKGMTVLLEGFWAKLPGVGTPTALALHGRMRGMIRGMADTAESYAIKLATFLDRWHVAGGQRALARAVQDYCAGTPKVKVVNRNGVMTTLDSDGNFTKEDVTWDWDSKSHPRRNDPDAPYWSEEWIIVYTPPWDISDAIDTSDPATLGLGIGTKSPRVDVDNLKSLFDTWKSAHSFIRGILWAYDETLFNPASPSTMPDGTWGSWSWVDPSEVPSHCKLSGRGELCQSNDLRVWESEREPPENLVRIV